MTSLSRRKLTSQHKNEDVSRIGNGIHVTMAGSFLWHSRREKNVSKGVSQKWRRLRNQSLFFLPYCWWWKAAAAVGGYVCWHCWLALWWWKKNGVSSEQFHQFRTKSLVCTHVANVGTKCQDLQIERRGELRSRLKAPPRRSYDSFHSQFSLLMIFFKALTKSFLFCLPWHVSIDPLRYVTTKLMLSHDESG